LLRDGSSGSLGVWLTLLPFLSLLMRLSISLVVSLSLSGIMCGVDGAISKASISAHARSVLLHAEARKTVKCVLREVKPDAAADAKAARQRPSHNNDADANKHKDKKFKTDK
jgi:hypothetical protein